MGYQSYANHNLWWLIYTANLSLWQCLWRIIWMRLTERQCSIYVTLFFYMQIFIFLNTTNWRCCLLSNIYWHTYQQLGGWNHVLSLALLFCSLVNVSYFGAFFFVTLPWCFVTVALYNNLRWGFFVCRIPFSVEGLFFYNINIKNFFSFFQRCSRNFDGDYLKSVTHFWYLDI